MAADENRATIERFYAAMGRHDGEAMAACYAPDATFCDPVFGKLLRPGEAADMWRMLFGRATDLTVELLERDADDTWGTAHWVARYTFGPVKRYVVNDVHSTLKFATPGLIIRQEDTFNFWRWSQQALGGAGWLLGWTPVLQHSVRDRARARLEAFRAP